MGLKLLLLAAFVTIVIVSLNTFTKKPEPKIVSFKQAIQTDADQFANYWESTHQHFNKEHLANPEAPVRFDNHQVWRLFFNDLETYKKLQQKFEEHINLVDVWTIDFEEKFTDVRITPSAKKILDKILKSLNIRKEQKIVNVQDMIDASNRHSTGGLKSFHDSYHSLAEIHDFMDNLAKKYPDQVSFVSAGKSYEERDIVGLKIGGKGTPMKRKREVVFHGGIHAREWIGPASMLFLMDSLLSGYGNDNQTTQLIDHYDWIIFPVLNVDGFEFTHTSNRMWRKTRQPNKLPWCIGTDPNRNWDWEWSKPGASSNPCSEAYYGSAPFSAVETKAMADFIYKRRTHIEVYADVHAFSQLWMFPWGASCAKSPYNEKKLLAAATAGANALRAVHGTNFKVGGICNVIYQASGNSVDWVYGRANISYAYALELRDTGRYGFMLPADQIRPSGQELFAGLLALVSQVQKQENE